jgi:hypothetical protein
LQDGCLQVMLEGDVVPDEEKEKLLLLESSA